MEYSVRVITPRKETVCEVSLRQSDTVAKLKTKISVRMSPMHVCVLMRVFIPLYL